MKRIFLGFIILVFFVSPKLAMGCSCARPDVIGEFKNGADIFIGHVLAIKGVENKVVVDVTFVINKSFNKSSEEKKIIRTGSSESNCGYPFEIGKEYFVVAEGGFSNICNGTKALSDAQEEISQLEKLSIPGDILWGEIKNNIQLSLNASTPTCHLPSQCVLSFRARNLLEQNQLFDARLPITNQSKLIIKDPDGEVREVNFPSTTDAPIDFILPPGETSLGSFHEEVLGVTEWSSGWFPRAETLKGSYQIAWELNHILSNTITVEIK